MFKEIIKNQLSFASPEAGNLLETAWAGINEKRYTISEIGVTHRWITYWDQQGILLEQHEDGKWRKFSLVEYVWLEAIKKMRVFHVPLPMIKVVREQLCNVKIDVSPKALSEYEKIIKNSGVDMDKIELSKEAANSILVNGNYLSFFVLEMILNKESFALLINDKGQYFPCNDNMLPEQFLHHETGPFLKNSYVRVSLSEILVNIMSNWAPVHLFETLGIITENEYKVLEALRQEKVISVNVKLNEEREIQLIESTKIEQVSTKNDLLNLIMREGYQEITLKTEKGKIVNCKNVIKTKIK
jgi:DNA-binding transcriptional MerR regulator